MAEIGISENTTIGNCDLKANIMKKQIIHIGNAEINLLPLGQDDYISLTDMAHSQMQEHIIFRWMSLKSTIEYIGEWEALYNPNFNYTEFGTIKMQQAAIISCYRLKLGLNAQMLSVS